MKQAQGKDVTKYRWADIAEEELNPLLTRKLITGDRVMLSELVLKKGCVVPAHHNENEQESYVIRGTLKLEVNGREIILSSSDVLHITSKLIHSGISVDETNHSDAFSPP